MTAAAAAAEMQVEVGSTLNATSMTGDVDERMGGIREPENVPSTGDVSCAERGRTQRTICERHATRFAHTASRAERRRACGVGGGRHGLDSGTVVDNDFVVAVLRIHACEGQSDRIVLPHEVPIVARAQPCKRAAGVERLSRAIDTVGDGRVRGAVCARAQEKR